MINVIAHYNGWLLHDIIILTQCYFHRAVFERSRRELSLEVSVGVHALLVVEQSSLESQSRVCAKTPILTVLSSGLF